MNNATRSSTTHMDASRSRLSFRNSGIFYPNTATSLTELRDGRHRGTPLGWALHAWGDSPPEPEAEPRHYCQVVLLLVAAGATVDSALPADPRRRSLLIEKMRANAHMTAALRGEIPAQ